MITYRPALPDDTASIVSLLAELMQEHGVAPPEDERLAETVAIVGACPNHLLLVAEAVGTIIGNTIVGMCTLAFSCNTWSTAPICELQDVIVTATYRRRRVGRGLIETAENIARDRGCSRLFLTVESWNLDAHGFYRSLNLAEKTCLYFERDLHST
ncbi:MAG: GNAT family N-acetyltransferase [Thermoleophilia bacterium]|jgi:GNAT superfamily N-acetyltransferase